MLQKAPAALLWRGIVVVQIYGQIPLNSRSLISLNKAKMQNFANEHRTNSKKKEKLQN